MMPVAATIEGILATAFLILFAVLVVSLGRLITRAWRDFAAGDWSSENCEADFWGAAFFAFAIATALFAFAMIGGLT